MEGTKSESSITPLIRTILLVCLVALSGVPDRAGYAQPAPRPLLEKGHPVDWWFVFKLNSKAFPACGQAQRACPFGGKVQPYKQFGQQFVFASKEAPSLKQGSGCAGDTTTDPIGATFDEIYNGSFYYVVWNDQFYGDPAIPGCGKGNCNSPWGHSKGMVAWNETGEGLVLQVSTPSWPGAGSKEFPRKEVDGNTLGCVADNNVLVSQHFFALKLTKDDLTKVLTALENASVATNPKDHQIVKNGGPAEVQKLVSALGTRSDRNTVFQAKLSTGVLLISKPSHLNVPPWQMVSALLNRVPLRTATWWANPYIPTTTPSTKIKCWDKSLGKPSGVEVATTGEWNDKKFGLKGGLGADFNHAKFGVSMSGDKHYAIFGDLNQQGTLSGANCASSQNGRGGLFYVLEDKQLSADLAALTEGETAPTTVRK